MPDEPAPPRRLDFRMEESVTFHLRVNGRDLTWLARLLRPIAPIFRWLVRRQAKRWKATNLQDRS